MNKTLALVALLGLVSAPAFANEAAKAPVAAPAKAEKVVAKEEAKKEGEVKAEDAAKEVAKDAKAAPAAEVKKEEVKK